MVSITWQERLPFLHQEMSKNRVHLFDVYGFSRETTEEQQEEIEKLQSEYPNLKVVAVLDAKYKFSDGNILHFNDYLLIDTEDDNVPYTDPNMNDINETLVYFLSYTKNLTDDLSSEMGTICVTERSGRLRRIY